RHTTALTRGLWSSICAMARSTSSAGVTSPSRTRAASAVASCWMYSSARILAPCSRAAIYHAWGRSRRFGGLGLGAVGLRRRGRLPRPRGRAKVPPHMAANRSPARIVATIAHVDHGKTTLVDSLLSIAGAFARGEGDMAQAMDSGDLERERGITITSKPTALVHGDVRINLVDTPGHADFGGEVERVLNMVDAVLLIVDAVEGPMPQTRFVTEKAVKRGLRVLLVVNKIDRAAAEPHRAVDATFDLLASLDASEEQLDFPVIYTSAVERYALHDPDGERLSM